MNLKWIFIAVFLMSSAMALAAGHDDPDDPEEGNVPGKSDKHRLPLDPNSPFLIKPYVFSEKGERIAVAWSYKNKSNQNKIELTLRLSGVSETIVPVFDHDLYVAELPLPSCGFGPAVMYQVPQMALPSPIADIPCRGSGNVTRFSFMADTQEGTEYANQFAKQAASYNGAAVLIGGDLVQVGSEYGDWTSFFEALQPALGSHVLFPAVGNHEYRSVNSVPLWKYFFRTEAETMHYAFDIGDARVIALNSCFEDDPSIQLKQLAWLKDELAKPARWRVVYFHHPAYSKGVVNNPHYPKKEYVTLQKDYLPLFEMYKVDLVLNGHTHIFERSRKNGIQYVTTGAAGGRMGIYGAKNPYSIMDARIRTMVELEVSVKALRAVTTSINGRKVDEFTLNKP